MGRRELQLLMDERQVTWTIGDAPYPQVRGVQGPRYKVGPLCAVLTCGRLADHAHHLWSRTFMGKPYDWVTVEDVTLPNLLPLCWSHHEDCTGDIGGYRAGIRYEPESGCLFWHWADNDAELEILWGTSVTADREVHVEAELCSECGRRKPLQRSRPEGAVKAPRRPKTRVVFTVPKDEREDGEAIVKDLVSQFAELRGRSENESYYTLVEGLTFAVLNYHPEAEEYTGEGPCPTCGTVPAA